MKIPIWLKQPITQVIFYVILYELLLRILKSNSLIKVTTSIGITSRYLFYLFLLCSIILSLFLYFKGKSKLSHAVSITSVYIIFTLLLFGFGSKLILAIVVIATISSLGSYLLYKKLQNHYFYF